MDQDSRSYFERRERIERAAAKKAACREARRIHQELAQAYAARVREQPGAGTSHEPATRQRLTIIAPSAA